MPIGMPIQPKRPAVSTVFDVFRYICITMLIKVNPLAGLGGHIPLILDLGSYPTLPVDRPSRVSSYAVKGGEYNGVRYETNSPISQHLLFS